MVSGTEDGLIILFRRKGQGCSRSNTMKSTSDAARCGSVFRFSCRSKDKRRSAAVTIVAGFASVYDDDYTKLPRKKTIHQLCRDRNVRRSLVNGLQLFPPFYTPPVERWKTQHVLYYKFIVRLYYTLLLTKVTGDGRVETMMYSSI